MDDVTLKLSDRQARNVILAAEQLGFMREPDLYEAHYDLGLHEDARCALAHLRAHDPAALHAALVADEPIPADRAAHRITESSRFTFDAAFLVLELACERGFVPPRTGGPLLDPAEVWNQARACVAFLWEHHPELLSEQIGEAALVAPLPETARDPRWSPWDDWDL